MSLANTTRRRGHWPKGQPRHAAIPAPRLRQIRAWFTRHAQGGPIRNDRSMTSVARAVGIDPRTLRRWLSGADHPDPAIWRALVAYLRELGPL